jgi:outer membrane protein assembly factor BamB
MRRVAIPVLLLGLLSTLSAGDNWPQYRGPNGDGHSDAKRLPTTWSETENIRWKVAVHDKGWSSPVVWGQQVWVTTAKEDGKEFYAVCLDRKTGRSIHDIHLFSEPNPDPKIPQYNSFASPTPCLEEGRIYAHFGTHGTACLDTASGKVLWQRRDLPCNHFRGPASSPVVYQDWLYLLFDGFDRQYVACLDKRTGKTVWQKDRDLPYKNTGRAETDGDLKKAFATPSVFEINGRLQLVAPAAMGTIAYDPATGAEIWRVIHGGMNESCRPILAHGLIYLTAGSSSTLLAVKAGGTGDLTRSGVIWKVEKVGPGKPSPIVVGDLVYFVNDTGIAFCLDARTGARVWDERLQGKFSASPVSADGLIYFPGENGTTFVVSTGREFNLVAANKLDAGCMASPAVAGSDLFLRTRTHLYCIGKD